MSEQRCSRCGGSGEIKVGNLFVDCIKCGGEGVIDQFDKVDGTTRDTSFSPVTQRDTHTF